MKYIYNISNLPIFGVKLIFENCVLNNILCFFTDSTLRCCPSLNSPHPRLVEILTKQFSPSNFCQVISAAQILPINFHCSVLLHVLVYTVCVLTLCNQCNQAINNQLSLLHIGNRGQICGTGQVIKVLGKLDEQLISGV